MASETNEAGYGTIQQAPGSNASPMTLKPDTHERFVGRLKLRMNSEVKPQKTYLILIGLFFVTGLVDSAAYNIWSCFVSMQTGMEQSIELSKYSEHEILPSKLLASDRNPLTLTR